MAAVTTARTVAVAVIGVALVGVVAVVGLGYRYVTEPAYTHVLNDPAFGAEYRTTVDGTPAAAGSLVELSLGNKYYAPGAGEPLRSVKCPPLKFVVGAEVTCNAVSADDGGALRIPVRVTEVTATEVSWRFER